MRKPLIRIDTTVHSDQRYPTWADWQTSADMNKLTITVSELPDWRYEYLSAIHELLEATLCRHQGITQADVDAFDVDYENRRMAGQAHAACGCEITNDPGSDIHAPYRAAHQYAEGVEYGLARLLGVDAVTYDNVCAALDGGIEGNRR
jgi:hypothetical protein